MCLTKEDVDFALQVLDAALERHSESAQKLIWNWPKNVIRINFELTHHTTSEHQS